MQMGFVSRLIMKVGLVGAILLCLFDFTSSMEGVRMVLPTRVVNYVTTLMPVAMAMLALACNAGSVYFFKMYEEQGLSSFASTWTFMIFIGFFAYDCLSSFVGLLSYYAGLEYPTFAGVVACLSEMGSVGAAAVFLLSALLASGPFLAARFSDSIGKAG
jgi:hypothetical protein